MPRFSFVLTGGSIVNTCTAGFGFGRASRFTANIKCRAPRWRSPRRGVERDKRKRNKKPALQFRGSIPPQIPAPWFSNSASAWTGRASRRQRLFVFVVIENHARRDFLRFNDLGVIQPQVKRVGFLVHVQSHILPSILRSKNTLTTRFGSTVLFTATRKHSSAKFRNSPKTATMRVYTPMMHWSFSFMSKRLTILPDSARRPYSAFEFSMPRKSTSKPRDLQQVTGLISRRS